uniref:AIPP2-like SPOC-like domain-containing protein n=1 Tax=Oryza punctata TaxID=4537 RepID=A0A0E0MJX4_ORYPU
MRPSVHLFVWWWSADRGIFKIDSKEYVSLAGHLSTKSCKIVCMLSRSLCALVNVTKHSRLEVWPASLGASGFTDENIALFLFPPRMRPDGKLDQLVKEVIENDLALRAVMGKTEMLIFPSTMLPKQYQAFQGKHYLWGLFRPRKDIVGIVEEQAAHAMSPMENAMCVENQEASKDGTKQVEFSGVREPNMGTEPQDPEGAEMQDASDQNMAPAIGGSNASRANQPSIAATEPANREQIDSSLGIPQGRMFAFVAQPTPRFEELMQELEREGALIATMPRVTYGPGQGRSQATAKE